MTNTLPRYILLWKENPQDLTDYIIQQCDLLNYVLVSTFTSVNFVNDIRGNQIITGLVYNAIIGTRDNLNSAESNTRENIGAVPLLEYAK